MGSTLFPSGLPDRDWLEFHAKGYAEKVSGLIYRSDNPPCCGLPIGGVGTGCIDMDVRGAYGFSSIFNPVSAYPHGTNELERMPRKLPTSQPFLGINVGGTNWVLADQEFVNGGDIQWCTEPFFSGTSVYQIEGLGLAQSSGKQNTVNIPKLDGVKSVDRIHYWGHFPIADMEFETDAPVGVALRCWAPFIPGDAAASNVPAAIFEVNLENQTGQTQDGNIAFNFPGPDSEEAKSLEFTREIVRERFCGLIVRSGGGVDYAVGVIDQDHVRLGAGLGQKSSSWAQMGESLPEPVLHKNSDGRMIYSDGSSSVVVGFSLQPGEQKTVRFILAWYAPIWKGANREYVKTAKTGARNEWMGLNNGDGDNYYAHRYASRFAGVLDVVRHIVDKHQSLLHRVLAWQSVVYAEKILPVWLRDSLINNLALISEDSYWAQTNSPLTDWAESDGIFALNESPRGCPQTACIPCDWYGNLPIVLFFPELALSTLGAFKHYQREDGEIPFAIGIIRDLPDFASPRYFWQVSLNGTCYVDMVDRIWQRTGDDQVIKEYYDSLKKCTSFTMALQDGPRGVISMPKIGGMEWFELGEWLGMCSHMGGLRLAHLRIMERMARHMEDMDYVSECKRWYSDGSRAMEEEMWTGSYYLNYYDLETAKKSDDIMAYQLDGQWAADFHGVKNVFMPDRIKKSLSTINKYNIGLTPDIGAANFCRPNGQPLPIESEVGEYGQYAMFTPELIILAMTYIYSGDLATGLGLAEKHWKNLVCNQGHHWDLPNAVSGDTGKRIYGTDYYQNMMLWALPAAIDSKDIKQYCIEGGFIDRIIQAAKE